MVFHFSRSAAGKPLCCVRLEVWAARRFDTVWVLHDDDRNGLETMAPRVIVRKLPGFGVGCDLEKFVPVSAAERDTIRSQCPRVLAQPAEEQVAALPTTI